MVTLPSPTANAVDGVSLGGTPSPCAVVALDIGGTKVAAGVVLYPGGGEAPRVLAKRCIATNAQRGGDAVLADVVALAGDLLAWTRGSAETPGAPATDDAPGCCMCEEFLASSPAGEEALPAGCTVLGIGVSAAGSIRESDGFVAYANEIMPGWMGQPLGAALEQAHGVPVAVLNDVRAHALGELRHGAAAGADSCIMVAAGTGLGGAVIVNGRVLGGSRGFAGMLGHTLHPAAVGVPSAWGTTGHLESVVSGSGIEQCYRLGGGEPLCGAQISQRALEGEPLAVQVIEQSGRSLGEAIASWADVIDPELVIVAGSVCNAGDIWRAALNQGLSARLAPELAGLRVADAVLGGDAPLIGAAEQLLDRL